MEQEIREALQRGTKGEWKIEGEEIWRRGTGYEGPDQHVWIADVPNPSNRQVIANAPTYLEWCLSQIAELRKEKERLEQHIERIERAGYV